MLKNTLIIFLLFVPNCPVCAEDLSSLIAPKKQEQTICDPSADGSNSAVMCQSKTDEKNISRIDEPETEVVEISATSALDQKIEIPPDEEEVPVRNKKSKKKIGKQSRIKNKKKLKNKSKPNSEPEVESVPEAEVVAYEATPKILAAGVQIKTFEYTVQEGDTLNTIIQKHFSENIQAGQKIIVVAQPNVMPESKPDTTEYIVKEGDTLSSILRKYFNGNIYGKRSRLEKLLELNKDIKAADTIYLGQKIIIPSTRESAKTGGGQTADEAGGIQLTTKLKVFLTYRFNYISVADTATQIVYNLNTDYDLEGGIEYDRQVFSKGFIFLNVGVSDFSTPRTVLSSTILLEPIRKTQGFGAVGYRHEFNEDNALGFVLRYRPYYFLTNTKLEYLPAPSAGLNFENHFYHENHTLLGFGFSAEAIGKQDYPQFKSENGSVLAISFLYRQEFIARDWITAEFVFQQRQQQSTFYKMNDKNAGFKFFYTLNF